MSSQAKSKSNSDTTRVIDNKPPWEDNELKQQGLAEWIGKRSGTVSTNTEPAAVESDSLAIGSNQESSDQDSSTGNSSTSDSDDSQPEATSSLTADARRIFVPDDKYCGIWHDSPNKERHASFGDGGTTASASCLGDLMQMSQYLGVGQSGVFTLDQASTDEPYFVTSRASDLDNLAKHIGSGFSFSLMWPYGYSPEGEDPPEVRWVNWRWPRYQYSCGPKGIKVCLQYMVHKGVVLQQFIVENTSDQQVKVDPFDIESTVLIRDLDFLNDQYPFNKAKEDDQNQYSYELGPNGYGHVCVRRLPGHEEDCEDGSECREHAVASVMTTFVNGTAIKFDSKNKQTSSFLGGHKLGNLESGANKVEIVIARKLLLLPNHPSDWRNFVISAKESNINHWLKREINSWGKHESLASCFERLPMTTTKVVNTGTVRDENASQRPTEKNASLPCGLVPNLLALVRAGENDPDAEVTGLSAPTDSQSFPMPTGTPDSGSDWNPTRHIEYLAWRHLEHVLSVCAMPLRAPGLVEVNDSPVRMPKRDTSISPVALTCGDISGHRINTSASFFAFKFLVDVGCRLQLLEPKHKGKYIKKLEKRIKTTCRGHVKWLQLIRNPEYNPPTQSAEWSPRIDEITTEHIIQAGCFAANYWVTGKVTTRSTSNFNSQPQNRMTDTALQIAKLEEYKKLVSHPKDKDLRLEMKNVLNDVYVPWLTELHRMDVRETCSWPHSNVNSITKFRLDDHFWIWKSLKCLDNEVAKIRLPPKQLQKDFEEIANQIAEEQRKWLQYLYPIDDGISSSNLLEGRIRTFMEIIKRLSPNNLQRTVLQHFTAENDGLKPPRRMMAAARSAMETRFLLHARDAALFYDEDVGFFVPGSSSMRLWRNTIDAQPYHEENMYSDSGNTLRYALGIAMGVRGHTLSRTKSASDLVKESINILLGAGGSDGLFPGQLDEGTREPRIFSREEHRDRFYHAGFEINCVLLSSATKFEKLLHKRAANLMESLGQAPRPVYAEPGRHQQPYLAETSNPQAMSETSNTVCVLNGQPEVRMKKSLPFNNAIPETNINHIGDEWLYRYPDFLRGRFNIADSTTEKIPAAAKQRPGKSSLLWHDTLGKANDESDSPHLESGTKYSVPAVHIVDIRKGNQPLDKRRTIGNTTKGPKPKSERHRIFGIHHLHAFLERPRTAWTAKKRIICLPYANDELARACCEPSSEREKGFLRRFFGRHARYTNDVLDETSLVRNEWHTELYLSFYFLVKETRTGGRLAGSLNCDGNSAPFPGHEGHEVRRASMSFRFDGDFFDRFWTCHFIDHQSREELQGNRDHWIYQQDGALYKQWSQRKALELYLLHEILKKIAAESTRFRTTVRHLLKIKQGSLALVSATSIRASMDDLQQFESILQLVEEDLAANLVTLSEKWIRREMHRGVEQPRWTTNDEQKHRANINNLCVDVERATGELKANHAEIRKLRGFVASTRQNKKSELQRRQDANIRYLTYVTVIFQPLAFAASFYSMGGAPEPGLIISLVEFSAAAFAVTLLLILGYRALAYRHEKNAARKESLENLSEKPSEKPSEKAPEKPSEEPTRRPADGGIDARENSKGLALSLRAVVHFLLSVVDLLARLILWCWEREVVINPPSINKMKGGDKERIPDGGV